MKVGELIEATCARFESADLFYGHGTDNAWDEAVALVWGVIGYTDDESVFDLEVNDSAAHSIGLLVERRIAERLPLPYLLGECFFAGYPFIVRPGVIIPRSPIAELIRNQFAPWIRRPPARVLDLCCGGGCIGIATALEFPEAEVVLVDIDEAALDLARENVAMHRLEQRVQVVRSDLYTDVNGQFDLILTNPPYVDAADLRSMPAEYRHEPVLALDGGADGLVIVSRIIEGATRHLNPGGVLIGEVGGSASALSRLFPRTAFVWVELEWGGEGVFVLDALQ